MNNRCGIHLIEIEDFQKRLEGLDKPQLLKLFCEKELDECHKKPNYSQSLAARFAAKEACLKLFPKNLDSDEPTYSDIEIASDNHGAPYVVLNYDIKRIMSCNQISKIFISISHTKKYACSIAVVEGVKE